MDLRDALKALHVAGRTKEVTELVTTEASKAARTYDEIRKDSTRTPEYTRWALATRYVGTRNDVERRITQMAGTAVRTDRGDAEAVFGVRGLPGDAASLTISRRDAADRVAKVEDRRELRDLLARATRSGDEVLARAVAERAVEMQDVGTMNQFIGDRPELEAAAERLWKAQQADDNSMTMTMQLAALRPHELWDMHRDSIESLADNEPSSAGGSADAWSGPFAQR